MELSIINFIIVSSILAGGVGLSFWVYIANKHARSNQLLALAIICTMVNLFFSFLLDSTTDRNIALFAGKLNWATVAMGMVILYYFIGYFPTTDKKLFTVDRVLVLLLGIVLVYLSLFTNLIIDSVAIKNGGLDVIPGPLMNGFYLGFCVIIGVAFYTLFKKYFKVSRAEKTKINYFLIGLLIFIITTIITSIVMPTIFGNENFTFIGDYSIIFFLGFTAFAIIKHRLFDVRFAVIRTVTYVLSLSVITGLYFLLAFAISKYIFGESKGTFSRGPADIGLVVLLALSFQPIKRFFDRTSNKLFFKDNYSSSDFFSRLNRIITLTTDLRSLLIGSANEIESTLKIEQVYFVVLKQNGRLITAGTNKHNTIPREDVNAIDEYIVSRGSSSIVRSLLDKDKEEHHMARLMQSHKTEIIVPLLLSDQRIGYLCLGDKKSSNFNNRDVVILESVADELTIAIQNALAVEEIRELNETLQQRITNATRELRTSNNMLRHLDKAKDEFVSMASHQLRTPLTSIKGYISMVLEGDAGKISTMQKQLLNEAFISSERMVHLINDFLNVSRIQTGKFIIDRTAVDLSKVVEQEIDSLQSSAIARNLRYKYTKPKDFPILNVDEGKLRQVIMNFADNALYYSHENTVIDVDLVVDGKEIVYTVKDTGIGVPKSEQEHLFSKFFRASNAKVQRPDGTGVGLYLAKRIINGHGGKVVFKSVEGKGSTFGFRLPIE